MKIKCPICKEEIDETHFGTDLGMHLYWQHEPKDEKNAGDVYRYYAVMIFKIHEKIESLNNNADYDFKHGYPSPSTETQIELLESLLENDKK